MKLLILISVLVIGISGYLIKVPDTPSQTKLPSLGRVHIQKLLLPFFVNVCEESTDPTIVRLAGDFNYVPTDYYTDSDLSDEFVNLKTNGLFLKKGEIFSEFNVEHLYQTKVLYQILYTAKTFDIFLKTAAWARQNVNCGLFLDAFYLSVINRRDTEKVVLPGPYEILPNYFINKDVMYKVSSILSGQYISPSDDVTNEGNAYTIDTNYTSSLYDGEGESKLAYFREDVGLNSYYFLQKLNRAPWFNNLLDSNDQYGEYLYHILKQLDTRYYLERYSNSLPEITGIKWDIDSLTPYDPELVYSDGNEFTQRASFWKPQDVTLLQNLQNLENELLDLVQNMVKAGLNKSLILNKITEILFTRHLSYDQTARLYFEDNPMENKHLSVLGHYLTSLRDPEFWRINKQMVELIDTALKNVSPYSRNELYFPGVEVMNVDVKKMSTAFETFDMDVTEALKSDNFDTNFEVIVRQQRLTHKPFTIKLNISSLVSQKGLVKVFVGPKMLPGELIAKKNCLMLVDSFEVNLKIGTNVISRSSEAMNGYFDEFLPLKTIRKKVEDAEFGLDALPKVDIQSYLGFPSRLMVPKGTPEGLPLQLFVIVAPYIKTIVDKSIFAVPVTEFNTAVLSPGYPFDLNIENDLAFNIPNALLKDFTITHKEVKDSYDKTDYANKNYDYSSKKGQYGGQKEYSTYNSNKKEYSSYNSNKKEYSKSYNYQDKSQNNVDEQDKLENEQNTKVYNDKDIPVVALLKSDDKEFPLESDHENVLNMLKMIVPTIRVPSVFDYIVHPIYDDVDDDDTEKVYE